MMESNEPLKHKDNQINNEALVPSVKALQNSDEIQYGQNQVISKSEPQQNALSNPQALNTIPVAQNEVQKEQASSKPEESQQIVSSESKTEPNSSLKKPQCSQPQHPVEFQKFSVQFSDYLFTFQLSNNKLTVRGQKQTGRKCLKSSFLYNEFTQQMKALFESAEQMWTILQSAQDLLSFEDFKLYFKIRLGGTEKRIQIPLQDHDCADQEYIQKLERVAEKYKHLSQNLTQQLQNQKNLCKCKNETPKLENQPQKKSINPKAQGKIKIDRNWLSRASSIWPDDPTNFKQKQEEETGHEQKQKGMEDDPLTQFQELIEKLNSMREQYNLLVEEIEKKILSSTGSKMLRLKLMGLEKKKKDFFYDLDLEKIKFANLKCRDDIYNEIDQFLDEIRQKYLQIQTTISLIHE